MRPHEKVERIVVGLALLVPLATLPALTSPAAHAAARLTCNGPWTVEPSPNVRQSDNSLNAVDAVSSSDVWAAGHKSTYGTPHALIEHWDGANWTVQPTPYVGDSELLGVAAISTSDAWAVGYRQGQPRALTLHWDGTAWADVPTPDLGLGTVVSAVSAASSSDVWAVGFILHTDFNHPLALHWDGSSWHSIPTPRVLHRDTVFTGVSAASSTDVWAVGNSVDNAQTSTNPIAMHWDGSRWTRIPIPDLGRETLSAVSASAPDEAWAVGTYGGDGYVNRTLTLHWDGTAWNAVASPNPGATFHTLWAVDQVSSLRAWAVGWYQVDFELQTLVLEWDGSTWRVMPSPNPNPDDYNYLFGVSAVSPTEAWAVGRFVDEARQRAYSTLAAHWCPSR